MPFNPSDPALSLHWSSFDAAISRWPVVVGTGDEIEAFLCAVLSRRPGVKTRLVGAGLDDREVFDLLCDVPETCLLLLTDSVAADQGLELLKRCRSLPNPPLVLYCLSVAQSVDVPVLLNLGVSVVLSIHSIGKLSFRKAAEALAAGQQFVDPAVPRALVVAEEVGVQLSVRERQVLSLLAKGCTNREIGSQLFIAHTTARDYVSSLIAKFQVGTRAAVAAKAVELGYTP